MMRFFAIAGMFFNPLLQPQPLEDDSAVFVGAISLTGGVSVIGGGVIEFSIIKESAIGR
jgi:hypothetical protein